MGGIRRRWRYGQAPADTGPLYNLSRTRILPEKFALIGVDLAEGTAESWRDHLYDTLQSFVGNTTSEFAIDWIDEGAWARLAEKMSYVQGDLTNPELYVKIRGALDGAQKAHGTQGNAIFYLAVADQFLWHHDEQLGEPKLTDQGTDKNGKLQFWRRVVIEKPFGHSLDSARQLNARICARCTRTRYSRIDHFLGKDTIQSIMAFVSPMGCSSRSGIAIVSIRDADHYGGDGRRGGARQVLRANRCAARHGSNHVFTLVSMVAMEPPAGFDATAIEDKKAELFAAMPAVATARAVRGQYGVEARSWASR